MAHTGLIPAAPGPAISAFLPQEDCSRAIASSRTTQELWDISRKVSIRNGNGAGWPNAWLTARSPAGVAGRATFVAAGAITK